MTEAQKLSATERAKRTLFHVEIPRDELALVIAEKCLGMKAPPGTDPTKALNDMERTAPGMGNGFRHAADAAVLYFHARINEGRSPQ